MFFLKGMKEYDHEEIKDDLLKLKIPEVKVIKGEPIVFIRKSDDEISKFQHILAHLSPDRISKNLTTKNHILCQSVKWKIYRRKRVFLCHKCQRIGHARVNCELGFRFVNIRV